MSLAVHEFTTAQTLLIIAGYGLSGVVCAVFAALGFGVQKAWERVLIAVFALAFLGYAGYLLFIFDGGTVFISFWPLIVPILLIVNGVRNVRRTKTGS
ncbi:MAG TPA: hypothetical protein VFE14_18880 [Micromonosporaceae bacterium]|nr:hypothetical protein [Micromonosporaceae bacterium]